PPTSELYSLSLHDALPISAVIAPPFSSFRRDNLLVLSSDMLCLLCVSQCYVHQRQLLDAPRRHALATRDSQPRSTRLLFIMVLHKLGLDRQQKLSCVGERAIWSARSQPRRG